MKSTQRVWRIRNSDYLASTVVEWFERLLPVPGCWLCSAVDLRLFESWRAVRHCGSYTVQRSGAYRDSLEQFGQQLSLWLLLASLGDPCHNSVTSSQSKFQILFLLSIGKSNSISFNVVINDASYFLHTSAPIEIRTMPHWETLCL